MIFSSMEDQRSLTAMSSIVKTGWKYHHDMQATFCLKLSNKCKVMINMNSVPILFYNPNSYFFKEKNFSPSLIGLKANQINI